MNIIAQILGLAGFSLSVISFQAKTKKGILFFQMLCGFAFTLHFFILGAFTGAFLNILSSLRSVVYHNSGKRRTTSLFWPFAFALSFILTGVLTWEGPVTLLPVSACLVYTVTLYMDNPSTVRRFIWTGSPCWIVYNVIKGSYGGVLTEIFAMCSIFTAIYRYDIKPSRDKRKRALADK